MPISARINVPLRLTLLRRVLNKQAINSSKLSNQYLLMSSDWRCQLKNYFTIRQYTNTEKLLLHNSEVSGLLSVYISLSFIKKCIWNARSKYLKDFIGKPIATTYFHLDKFDKPIRINMVDKWSSVNVDLVSQIALSQFITLKRHTFCPGIFPYHCPLKII